MTLSADSANPGLLAMQVLSGDAVSWRKWGDEIVAYAGVQGLTHLLSPAAGAVFESLLECRAPVTPEGLLTLMENGGFDLVESEVSEEARMAVQAILVEFVGQGLAKQLPS